jgi:hypothetical protein
MHVPTSPNGTHTNGRTHSPTAPDAQPPAAEGGRDAHGRFGKGNPGSARLSGMGGPRSSVDGGPPILFRASLPSQPAKLVRRRSSPHSKS